jgi:predicted DNA-binding protein
MTSRPDHRPGQQRVAVRTDARLDAATRQKVDDLAQRFHTPRAAVLCHIMHWGLNHGQTGPLHQGESPGPVRHLHLYVPSDLHKRVQQAATAAGVKAAPWLRHMVRQITITDFPASWQEATPRERSHDSRIYTERFMLRLDDLTQDKLEDLSTHFDKPAAEIIRHLITQAKPEDFPKSWQMRAAERHIPRVP